MSRTPPPATTPSFERSAKPLLLALKPSAVWFLFLLVLHLLAIVAIVIAAIPLAAKILLTLCILARFVLHSKQHRQEVQLVWRTGNRWFINDSQKPAELFAINFFSRHLVILSLLSEASEAGRFTPHFFARKRKFVIPFDSLDKETFRLLRVRLRIEGHELLNPAEETIK